MSAKTEAVKYLLAFFFCRTAQTSNKIVKSSVHYDVIDIERLDIVIEMKTTFYSYDLLKGSSVRTNINIYTNNQLLQLCTVSTVLRSVNQKRSYSRLFISDISWLFTIIQFISFKRNRVLSLVIFKKSIEISWCNRDFLV